ncbi:MAG: rod shape-determining protein MreC [Candidatus Kryptoniota bacterium]
MWSWISEFFRFARNYVIFAVLVSISLFLVAANGGSRLRDLQAVGLVTTAYFESALNGITSYFGLAAKNKELEDENARLIDETARIRRSLLENEQLRKMLNLQQNSGYKLSPANVIGRSVDGGRNLMTLDIGSADSVRMNYPVVSGDGLVGIVIAVTPHYSLVQTLLDKESRIAARLVGASADGIIDAGEFGLLSMKNVPRRYEVKVGDIVETSTLSSLVPPDITIGTVSRAYDKRGDIFKEIEVLPAVDISSISVVFVMRYNKPPGPQEFSGVDRTK